jgi:DNA repair photolyase
LARRLEPRASSPERRLHAIEQLSKAGVPTTVMVAPIIPAINDAEIETILTRASAMGAREAGYVMLRLPLELRDIFQEWLLVHFPDKLKHVMTLVQAVRDGKVYDSTWGKRMIGTGPYAWMIGRRFEMAMAKNGFAKTRASLRTDLFVPPTRVGEQLSLLGL